MDVHSRESFDATLMVIFVVISSTILNQTTGDYRYDFKLISLSFIAMGTDCMRCRYRGCLEASQGNFDVGYAHIACPLV